MIAFYYGLTGLACVWYYRSTLTESARSLWLRGILPLARRPHPVVRHVLVPLVLLAPRSTATRRGPCRARTGVIGGVFVLDFGAILLGIVLMFVYQAVRPAYFRGEVLNRDTPTRVPEELGVPVGLFGIEPFETPSGREGHEPNRRRGTGRRVGGARRPAFR